MKKLTGYLAGKQSDDKWNWAKRNNIHLDLELQGNYDLDTPKYWDHVIPENTDLGLISGGGYGGTWGDSVNGYIIDAIKSSAVLIAYIECTTAYGTIAEIGYASALEIPCFVFFDVLENIYQPNKVMFNQYEQLCEKFGVDLQREDQPPQIAEAMDQLENNLPREKTQEFVDTYWLVSLFPRVKVYLESEVNPREIILRELEKYSAAYEPPTSRQLSYLRFLGVRQTPTTKLEAGQLIHKAKEAKETSH